MLKVTNSINSIILLLSVILCKETLAINNKDGRSILLFTETSNCTGNPSYIPPASKLTVAAAQWTLEQLKQLYSLDIGLEVVSTCGNITQDKWTLLHSLYKFNHTSELHIVLASRMNKELGGYVSSLGLEHTIVEPIPPRPDLVTLSALARHSGMRKDIPTGNATVLILEPKKSVVEDFYTWIQEKDGNGQEENQDVFEDPMAWQIMKAIYGVMIHNVSSVDFNSAREGLHLSILPKEYRIQERSPLTSSWHQLGAFTGGEFTWVRSQDFWNVNNNCAKGWCTCVNGLYENKAVWIFDTWVTALATLAGLGLTCCLAIFVFLCSQCGQVLEGGQSTTFLLLLSTVLTFLSMLPYCFQPGMKTNITLYPIIYRNIVCTFRTTAPPISVTFLISILLSRSLLLATSDSGGLPGHASGCLQAALLLLMLSVEAALFGLEAWHRQGAFYTEDGTCYHRSWEWLVMMAWPAILLLVQTFLTPGIWRSRRNYKEGVLFSLAAIAICFVTGAWVAVYIVCAELYGDHWEDISVCAGLVATATCILLIIFIPKVYLMTVWGSGQDLSLHLPETATSTLHTDTLSYIPANTNIYKTKVDQNTVAYVNLNPNRDSNGKLTNSNGHYGSSYIMGTRTLLDVAKPANLTYRLDSSSEPADNISWEPFYSGSNSRTGPPILAQSQSALPIQPNNGTLGSAAGGIPSTRL